MERKGLCAEESELLRRIREMDDPEAKERFFARYEDLLHRFAHKYHSDRLPYEDAFQLAALGMMKAMHRFDPDRGISFITFAYPTVEGELKKHYRDHLDIVRLPRPLREKMQRVNAEARRMWDEGVEPTASRLAESMCIGEEEVGGILAALQNAAVFSLDTPYGEGDMPPLSSFVGSYDPAYEEVEEQVVVNHALSCLPQRHRQALELRLKRGWTQAMIAKDMEISQMHVSRLIKEAVEIMQGVCSSQEESA